MSEEWRDFLETKVECVTASGRTVTGVLKECDQGYGEDCLMVMYEGDRYHTNKDMIPDYRHIVAVRPTVDKKVKTVEDLKKGDVIGPFTVKGPDGTGSWLTTVGTNSVWVNGVNIKALIDKFGVKRKPERVCSVKGKAMAFRFGEGVFVKVPGDWSGKDLEVVDPESCLVLDKKDVVFDGTCQEWLDSPDGEECRVIVLKPQEEPS